MLTSIAFTYKDHCKKNFFNNNNSSNTNNSKIIEIVLKPIQYKLKEHVRLENNNTDDNSKMMIQDKNYTD